MQLSQYDKIYYFGILRIGLNDLKIKIFPFPLKISRGHLNNNSISTQHYSYLSLFNDRIEAEYDSNIKDLFKRW